MYFAVFDGQELLESSIRALRTCVDYLCVVYQTVSNFGNDAHPKLKRLLDSLKMRGVVNDVIYYDPQTLTESEKRELVSQHCTEDDLGCPLSQVSVNAVLRPTTTPTLMDCLCHRWVSNFFMK